MRDDFSLYKYVTYVSVELCGTDLKNIFNIVNPGIEIALSSKKEIAQEKKINSLNKVFQLCAEL